MKSRLIFAFFILAITAVQSQILFEEGYIIENNGNKINCLIRNVDWKNNPTRFRYKLTDAGTTQTIDITQANEVGIIGKTIFKKFRVAIDKRSYLTSSLNLDREPEFHEELLFLRLLVDGEAKLYMYENGNLIRFFYRVNDSDPEQLIYTKYKSGEGRILENLYYKSQLSAILNCNEITSQDIDRTQYKKKRTGGYF